MQLRINYAEVIVQKIQESSGMVAPNKRSLTIFIDA